MLQLKYFLPCCWTWC